MPMPSGESVGDFIVRNRLAEMTRHPERANEISTRFTPRSLQFERWPPKRSEGKGDRPPAAGAQPAGRSASSEGSEAERAQPGHHRAEARS